MVSTARKVWILAFGTALLVVVLPWLMPAGLGSGMDVGAFLSSGRMWTAAALVFLGGLLTARTPCVYPLIPITVSVFGAKRAEGRGRALLVTSAYVLGMALVFSALGVAAAKAGQAFGSHLGDPRLVLALASLLLLLAASMFGAYELSLPPSVALRLNNVGGSGVVGAFLMGSVSGFIAAPCTGPVLSSLLTFVAKTQSVTLGAGLMFIYALGIGLPFFLIGVFVVRMPRGGEWMEWVKSVLGISLVALAALYIRDAFPVVRGSLMELGRWLGELPMGVAAAVLSVLGVLAGAIHLSFKGTPGQRVLKGIGVLLVVGALIIRAGTLAAPAKGTLFAQPNDSAAEHELIWTHRLSGDAAIGPLDEALALAKREGKPVMIDFFAEWCAACKELDRDTYTATAVIDASKRFVRIKIDGTNESEALDSLYDRYKIVGLPTILFFSSTGQVLNDPRITGFLDPKPFLAELDKVP